MTSFQPFDLKKRIQVVKMRCILFTIATGHESPKQKKVVLTLAGSGRLEVDPTCSPSERPSWGVGTFRGRAAPVEKWR